MRADGRHFSSGGERIVNRPSDDATGEDKTHNKSRSKSVTLVDARHIQVPSVTLVAVAGGFSRHGHRLDRTRTASGQDVPLCVAVPSDDAAAPARAGSQLGL